MEKLKTSRKSGLVLAALILALAAAPAAAQQQREREYGPGAYTGSVLSNIIYIPAKVVLATGGAVTSGLAYLVTIGDRNVSGSVWDATVGGDYILTPAMVAGDERVEFIGERTRSR